MLLLSFSVEPLTEYFYQQSAGVRNFIDSDFGRILSLRLSIKYMPYFLFGIISKMYFNRVVKLLDWKWPVALALIVFVLCCIDDSVFMVGFSGFLGIFVVLGVFYHTKSFWSKDNMFSRLLKYLGNNTLPIYLFHYFIIYYIGISGSCLFLAPIIGNSVIEFPVVISVTLIIALLCVGIDSFLKRIGSVHDYIFPKLNRQIN